MAAASSRNSESVELDRADRRLPLVLQQLLEPEPRVLFRLRGAGLRGGRLGVQIQRDPRALSGPPRRQQRAEAAFAQRGRGMPQEVQRLLGIQPDDVRARLPQRLAELREVARRAAEALQHRLPRVHPRLPQQPRGARPLPHLRGGGEQGRVLSRLEQQLDRPVLDVVRLLSRVAQPEARAHRALLGHGGGGPGLEQVDQLVGLLGNEQVRDRAGCPSSSSGP